MDYNYHTHTFFCRHATGTPEEYVKVAIDGNIKYMGFSDHIPLVFEDGYEHNHRVYYENVYQYFAQTKALAEKYKDVIDIKVGFEMEYYADEFDKMYSCAKEYGAEYLICGEHFYCPENTPEGVYVALPTKDNKVLEKYTTAIVNAMKTGVFTYIAHPDIVNFQGDQKLLEKCFLKICKASKKYNTPLELNFLGIRRQRFYPNELLWYIAGKEQCPVTFGFDAHEPEHACDNESLKIANDYVKKYNLNYIGKPELKPLV